MSLKKVLLSTQMTGVCRYYITKAGIARKEVAPAEPEN